MAGEFYMPNFGQQSQGFNMGQGMFNQIPSMSNWDMPQANPNYGVSMGSPIAFNMPQSNMTPDQVRYGQINQQMAPNSFMSNVNLGINGINTLGNLFLGFQAMRQAQEAATWQQGMATKNYNNSVTSYNSQVDDKIRSRYGTTTDPAQQAAIDAKVNERKIGG